MSLLQKLSPTNLLAEKEKFFADETYNPQFLYEEKITVQDLTKYGSPQKKYVDIAEAILEKSYFSRNEQDLFMMEGNKVDQHGVTQKVQTFLEIHNLEKRFDILWSSSFISRASITTNAIKLRLPVDFRDEGLIGMIYHEIGTHALRRINYEKQPWFKKKKQYGFGDHLVTEEGLAVLHALIPHSFKSAFIAAIRYLAITFAQDHSFAEVWKFLGTYVQDPERRWIITFRAKRGLEDTSFPGGFTKDLVYLQGMVDVWDWLNTHDFDITPLYYGKIAVEDVDKAVPLNFDFQPLLPSFFTLNKEKYISEINKIGEFNLLAYSK